MFEELPVQKMKVEHSFQNKCNSIYNLYSTVDGNACIASTAGMISYKVRCST